MSFGLGLGSSGVGSRKGYVLAPNPKVLSATLGADGETLTIVFDKTMAAGSDQVGMRVWESGKFGDSVAAVYDSGAASDTLVFATDSVFPVSVALKLGYTQPGDGFVSGADLLLSFSGKNVINNSSQVVDPPIFNVDPTVTGSTAPGSTLTRTLGSTSGGESVTGQWFKNGVGTSITTSTYSDTVDGDSVKWRSSATNGGGTTTADSNIVAVATPSAGASMTVAFDISGYETGYTHRIEVTPMDAGDTVEFTLAEGENSHTFTGLEWNTQYSVEVVRIDGSLNESSPITADIYTSPEFGPTGFAAVESGSDTINLSWTAPDPLPAVGYQIDISDDGTTWTELDQVDAEEVDYSVTGLEGGDERFFRIRGYNYNPYPHDPAVTAWSAAVSATTEVDVTAPVVSLATATQTGSSTASLSVTTDEGNGKIYWFISSSGTPPSAGDLIAGTGAVFATDDDVVATGVQTGGASGLTSGATYYLHALHKDAAGNNSNIVTSASFVCPISYLLAEDFNSGALPSGWSVVKGTPDWTATAIEGAYSVGLNGKATGDDVRIASPTFSAIGACEVYMKFKVTDRSTSGVAVFVKLLKNITNAGDCSLLQKKMRVGNVGAGNQDSVSEITVGSVYHLWIRRVPALSGGFMSIAYSTDGVRPISGDSYAEVSVGTTDLMPDRLEVWGDWVSVDASYDVTIDRVLVSSSPIGDNP